MVEFALVFLPLFAFSLLLLDVAWAMFAQASVQSAVRQGVRWGVTCQMTAGQAGLNASIRQIVIANSMGFVTAANASSVLKIEYLNPNTLKAVGTGGAAGGNLLRVSVSGLSLGSFGPLYRGGDGSVALSGVAAEVMEGSPANTCAQ